jgi:tetratricopeptide (TPR) repeat protein
LYWRLLATSLRDDLQDEERAIRAEQRGMAIMPYTATAWFEIAVYNNPRSQYLEAETAYKQAIEIDPKYAAVWLNLGNLLQYHLGRHQEAEAAYRRAIELDPKNASFWNGLGCYFRAIGKCRDAATSIQDGLAIASDQPYLLWNFVEIQLCYGQLQAAFSKLPHALAEMRKGKSLNSLRNALFLALAINDNESVLNAKDALSVTDERDYHQCSDTALVFLLHAIAFDDQQAVNIAKMRLLGQMKSNEEQCSSLERAYFLSGFRPELRDDLAALARDLLEVGPGVTARFKDVPKPAYMLDRFRRFAYEGGAGAGDPADLPLWCFDCAESTGQPVCS